MRTFLALVLLFLAGCAADAPRESRDTLYQVATIQSLLDGGYEGETDLAALREHGDLGIGTFQDLDGEMLLLDGEFYQVRSDGRATRPSLDTRSPFACVTFFEPDTTLELPAGLDYDGFRKLLDEKCATASTPYAIRIRGTFTVMRTRSVPRQQKPYPRLVEVVKVQPIFTFENVTGTLVGFCLPKSLEGVNVPGCHLHFLKDDGTAGGHVQAFTVHAARAELDESPEIRLIPPRRNATPAVAAPAAPATAPRSTEIERVEK
jgi:acetolactate decarboxylase